MSQRFSINFLLLLTVITLVTPEYGHSQSQCKSIFSQRAIGLQKLGQEKDVSYDGKKYVIIERQRSLVPVPKELKSRLGLGLKNIFANLELSPGQYWTGRLDPKDVESVRLIVEPRFIDGQNEGHAMLSVRLKKKIKFYLQTDFGVTKKIRDLVFSINPQVTFMRGKNAPENFRFLRYRVISREEILRKYKKSPPFADVMSYNLSLTKGQVTTLISHWLKQAVEKGESETFDYFCNNCATNLHSSFDAASPPQTLYQKLKWKISGFHFLGGNEGKSFPKTLKWRGMLAADVKPQVFFKKAAP